MQSQKSHAYNTINYNTYTDKRSIDQHNADKFLKFGSKLC